MATVTITAAFDSRYDGREVLFEQLDDPAVTHVVATTGRHTQNWYVGTVVAGVLREGDGSGGVGVPVPAPEEGTGGSLRYRVHLPSGVHAVIRVPYSDVPLDLGALIAAEQAVASEPNAVTSAILAQLVPAPTGILYADAAWDTEAAPFFGSAEAALDYARGLVQAGASRVTITLLYDGDGRPLGVPSTYGDDAEDASVKLVSPAAVQILYDLAVGQPVDLNDWPLPVDLNDWRVSIDLS